MAPHTVGAIDGDVMDQRTVCVGCPLDSINGCNDCAHVLAAVLVPAGKSAVEGVDDDPDDGQAGGLGKCFGCGDDPVCIDLAGTQVDHFGDHGKRNIHVGVMLAPRQHPTLHHRTTLYGDIEHASLGYPPAAVVETCGDMAAGIEYDS